MRGQAQALHSLLVFNLTGIVGAFLCEWLYRGSVDGASGWPAFWWFLSGLAALPLAYFVSGLIRKSPG